MADVRCPMCGKPNSAEQEVCQFCQARLKPLRITQLPDEEPSHPAQTPPSGNTAGLQPDAPDWLRSLRRRQKDSPETEDASPDWPEGTNQGRDNASSLDWLSSLRDRSQEESEEPLEEEVHDEPGGAESHGGKIESGAPEPRDERNWWPSAVPHADREGSDWLASIRSEADESATDDVEELDPVLSEDEEPGWLQKIRSRHKSEEPEFSFPDHPGDDPGDGVGLFFGQSGFFAEREDEPEQPVPSEQVAEEPLPVIPDWLSDLKRIDSISKAEEQPGWLSQEDELPEAPSASSPTWLSGMAEQPDAVPVGEDEPSWLSRKDVPKAEPATSSPADELPDWLEGLGEEPAQTTSDASTPAWTAETHPGSVPTQPQTEEELPAWMVDGFDQKLTGEEDTSYLSAGESEQPDEYQQLTTGLGSPLDIPSPGKSAVAPFAADDESLAHIEPLSENEFPDWLNEVKLRESPPASSATPGFETDAGLAPAELPNWLEAMRPVEAAASLSPLPDENESQVENAGPLSGLRGVLPAEPGVVEAQKPPTYSIKLQVSDENQSNAALLEELVLSEGEAHPIPHPPVISSQFVLRIAIGILLILAVLWPLVSNDPQLKLPDFPLETGAVNQIIESLSGGTPVLLAIDYDPGLSAEMDAAAAGVLDHLMLKGAYLTVVSTSPTGPAQAERLFALVNRLGGHQYQTSDQYTNFGFIPGGAAGLLSFARSPRQVIPVAYDVAMQESGGWQNAHLQPVQSLADFALVAVVTENPEDARAWIEQVQPSLNDTPLVMVVSAQAEPLVRPYYESSPRQVQGLVTGLAGGAAYENLNGRSGAGRTYWSAFSFGLLAASLLILSGGIVSTILVMLGHRKENLKGEG